MICHILALGPSIKHYKPDGNFSIGCNDSFKHHPSNYLICVSRLSPERDRIVMDSKPEKLLAFKPPYISHPAYEYIGQVHRWRPDMGQRLDKGYTYYSNNTPFIACSVAFNLGYRTLVLWGVDFTDHPNINGESLQKTVQDFVTMSEAMRKAGATIYLGAEGSVLPFPIFSSTFAVT